MPVYRYRAVHGSGRVMQGVATASNEIELAQFLSGAQMELIEARAKKAAKAQSPGARFSMRAPAPRRLTLFCAQMAELLQAGVVLLDALTDLAASMEEGGLRDALQDILRSLGHGRGVAEAFARHARVFPPVFVAILASGEASGDLTRSFEQLALYVEGRARLQERLRRALRYPLFMLAVALGVVGFMMTMVVPQIVGFLRSIDSQLPPATRLLIALSDLFGAVWWMAGLAAGACAIGAAVARRVSPRAARCMDAGFLRLPRIGKVAEKLMLARFAQSFAILAHSGLALPDCLRGSRDTLGNRELEARLDDAARRIAAGCPLSSAMARLFPPSAARILRIGEQGGHLAKSLGDIAAHYDREAAESAERMIGLLEPGLTLLIGALLAWVVLAVLGPIYGSLARMNVMG